MASHSTRETLLFFSIFAIWQANQTAGCSSRELGIKVPSPYRLPDSHMSASSTRGKYFGASRARVGLEPKGPWQPAWCAALSDKAPYLQVYFSYLASITAIDVEGVTLDGKDFWVDNFNVSVGNSTAEDAAWITCKENGTTAEFETWHNRSMKSVSMMQLPAAHLIRIYPAPQGSTWTCMRIALYGCLTGSVVHTPPESLENQLKSAPRSAVPLSDPLLGVVFGAVLGAFLTVCLMLFLLKASSYRFSPAHPSFKSPVQGQATHPQAMSPHSKQLTPTKQGSVASPPLPYEVQAVEVDLGPDVDECHQKAAQSGEFSFEDRNKIFGFNRGV